MSIHSSDIPEFICTVHRDDEEVLELVCMAPECANVGLLCRRCSKKSHSEHRVVSAEKLVSQYINCHLANFQSQDLGLEQAEKSNKGLLACTSEEIRIIREKVNQYLDRIEQLVRLKFEENNLSLERQVELISNITANVYRTCSSDTLSEMNEKVTAMMKAVIESVTIRTSFQEITKQVWRMKQHLVLELQELRVKIIQSEERAITVFDKTSAFKAAPLLAIPAEASNQCKYMSGQGFSSKDKHQDIKVNGAVATMTKDNDKFVCVAGEDVLNFGDSQVHHYRLRVLSQGTFSMYLGVALQSVVRENQFRWGNFGRPEHGHYIVSSTGRTYSSETSNYKTNEFKFDKNDIIEMQFDSSHMLLSFLARGKQLKLEIMTPPSGDCYRLVVYLHDQGDSVQLLQK